MQFYVVQLLTREKVSTVTIKLWPAARSEFSTNNCPLLICSSDAYSPSMTLGRAMTSDENIEVIWVSPLVSIYRYIYFIIVENKRGNWKKKKILISLNPSTRWKLTQNRVPQNITVLSSVPINVYVGPQSII